MRISTIFALALMAACGANSDGNGNGDGGNGDGGNGDGGGGGDGGQCGTLSATIRDFRAAHPDFEEAGQGDDRGLVQVNLGGDGKPVYAPGGATTTVSGQASFDQWYRDVAGVNLAFIEPLPLTENPPGTYTFDDSTFWPLDGKGFGEEVMGHNFHFTTEVHGTFVYKGGEIFSFTGDDDVFVFVNGKLGLDLGGVHGQEMATIDFDAQAGSLGIQTGRTYPLDVFHAERHTVESNFRMVTTIDCFIVN